MELGNLTTDITPVQLLMMGYQTMDMNRFRFNINNGLFDNEVHCFLVDIAMQKIWYEINLDKIEFVRLWFNLKSLQKLHELFFKTDEYQTRTPLTHQVLEYLNFKYLERTQHQVYVLQLKESAINDRMPFSILKDTFEGNDKMTFSILKDTFEGNERLYLHIVKDGGKQIFKTKYMRSATLQNLTNIYKAILNINL